MGDVALLTPALKSILAEYPNVQITFLTRGNFAPFFFNIPNLNVIGLNFKSRRYKGIWGLWKMYKEISKLGPFHSVIDLHGSLRSILFSFIFKLKKVPVFKINKGRREKNAQIRQKNKILTPLPHTVERYLKVFEHAGFPTKLREGPWINVDPYSKILASEFLKSQNLQRGDSLWIGFAPFAGHELKEWPIAKSKDLVSLILKEFKAKVFLFGSHEELSRLQEIKSENEECILVAGTKLGIKGDLGVLEKMDLLVGMDSSNLHIMALLGKPVIGLYGTTHPFSGFGPFMQEKEGVLQVDLVCRPCSIYGNTECFRKDFACMELIHPADVIRRIRERLSDRIRRLSEKRIQK